MKPRNLLLIVAFCFTAFALCMAQSPMIGKWKLDEAKSKFPPNTGKNHTVIYEAAGDQVKITVDGVDKDGKPVHNEWSGKFDGKPYAVTGDPGSDMRTYKKISDHKLTFDATKAGKKTMSGVVTVSADGKTRTVMTKDGSGKPTGTAVYEKEQ